MRINSDELAEYVKAVLEGIQKGLSQEIIKGEEPESFSLTSPVKFKVGIETLTEKEGEVRIYVAGVHAGKSGKESGQIEFEVGTTGAIILTGLERLVGIWEKLTQDEKDAVWGSIFKVRKP